MATASKLTLVRGKNGSKRPVTEMRDSAKSAGSPLTPELKEFADRVLVPILLKEYLASVGPEIELAKEDSGASNSETAARLLRQLRRP
jgi:hypothetical protein